MPPHTNFISLFPFLPGIIKYLALKIVYLVFSLCYEHFPQMTRCISHNNSLCQCSFSMKRYQDHSHSYKGKTLIDICLHFQRFSSLSS